MFVRAGLVLQVQLEQLPAHASGAVGGHGAQQPPCRVTRCYRTASFETGTEQDICCNACVRLQMLIICSSSAD